jgi:hypothetical protein
MSTNTITSISETVGMDANSVKEFIEKEHPTKKIILVNVGQPVTKDFRRDRIRIFHDDNNIVVDTPHIG